MTLIIIAGILGLIIGSFLNVVIYRLPIMIERNWRQECAELLQIDQPKTSKIFNLSLPRSHCPHCQHQLTILENIPLISYIWQRGKCTHCQTKINFSYPLVETISAILAMITAWHFEFLNWTLLAGLALTWALIAASAIDIKHQILPDNITIPFLWLGLYCNLFGLYTNIESSVIGAIIGYLSLWSIYWIYKLITGKEGIGYGDFKLLAMLGAWLGWQALLPIILIASIVAATIGSILIFYYGKDKNIPIAFGPYLASAGWISLLWSDIIIKNYLIWISQA
jgi:leader peptidase (prepilin peptidase)/N-methyltransferase